ncbi:MAG: sugar phosphate isomerase/epimerase [Spirochaetaceae bacterium]|nr:sugar phosphate isomerase/epimerase [Spirochaetaceae bacterium]MCF7947324.1 sugar phosphate isomerase/epimerase [Spirochaetia bacterium]MCF7950550.1 sugar phosphate isomerase/epimerase [Spirochaetaceae bacterium]
MKNRKIAFSLPHTYLTGHISSKRDHILHQLYGEADVLLSRLSQVVRGIEISSFDAGVSVEAVEASIQSIWNSKLEVIIHAYLPEEILGNDIASVYPWLEMILERAQSYQNHLLINIHALASKTIDTTYSLKKTINNLKQISLLIKKEKYPISFAVEINREKNKNDPSTGYENLIEICRQVDNPKIGIGWDIGHTYYNVCNSYIPKDPPREFIERVVHTHIHDLNSNGQTHWPLVTGNLPLKFYLQKLQSVAYNQYHTLELYPERFIDTLSADITMFESIEILKKAET